MAKKITYLLGAGASANVLPLIKKSNGSNKPGLPEELEIFIQEHKIGITTSNPDMGGSDFKILEEIVDNCKKFGTPDLYAKFLLEVGDMGKYESLKNLLSSYFTTKQELNKLLDIRALAFLTTISQNQQLPENIRIISWNYDSQIEIAAKKLKIIDDTSDSVIKGFSSWPNHPQGDKIENYPFLFHINGVAGFRYSQYAIPEKIDPVYHFGKEEKFKNMLSFAWETKDIITNNFFLEKRTELVKKIAEKTEILVVIGYSFPFFNRNIDKEIIYSMKPTLNKIYFQDPNSNGSHLINLFGLHHLGSSNITHIQQVENYHIPYEL
ncbi:MAG: hypothetical protein JSU05_03545 [Bacteroidetes bacterium]|nr:hypothetical protein [Bacteroidota bacterium]